VTESHTRTKSLINAGYTHEGIVGHSIHVPSKLNINYMQVCGGNGTSCLGCDKMPFSNKTFDRCGVCAGDGTTCDTSSNSSKYSQPLFVCETARYLDSLTVHLSAHFPSVRNEISCW